MGGKSRKSGGVSKQLINQLKNGNYSSNENTPSRANGKKINNKSQGIKNEKTGLGLVDK